ncbi:MAG: PepSY-associated TM helix domain-containing protein [Bryobacteraceae bacterium]
MAAEVNPLVAATPARPVRVPTPKQRLSTVSRWLHIYLSMVSFAIVFFFAVTGLTLNHADWFGTQAVSTHRGQLPQEWVAAGGAPAKLEIVERLRSGHGVRGALSDFRVDDSQLSISFKGPGYAADTFVDRASGAYDLTETRMGAVAVLNDLHKGRDTGHAWSWVIDVSAGLMAVVSLTGLILILFLKKRLVSGLMTAAVGGMVIYLIYLAFVP